jgi:hypothetical protein
VRKRLVGMVLFFVEAGESNPAVGPAVSEGPVEVPTGCRQCRAIGDVIAPFGESACQIGRISADAILISITAERPIRVLQAQQPLHRALGGNAHLLVTCLAMPRRQSVNI